MYRMRYLVVIVGLLLICSISECFLVPLSHTRQPSYKSSLKPATLSIRRYRSLTVAATEVSLPVTRKTVRPTDTIADVLRDGGLRLDVAKCFDDDTVGTAIEAMNAARRSSAIIYSRDGKISGIFTERDFVTRILDSQLPPTETAISAVMTQASRLITGSIDMTINQCQKIMIEKRIRHLPIADGNDVLAVISLDEIVRNSQNSFSSSLFGESLDDVEEQQKELSNKLALEAAQDGKNQDVGRTIFVVSGFAIIAALLQHDWVHDHEWVSMATTFCLGYIGIIFENYFEFHKAAIALLMAAALWTIYAGQAGATGITMPEALHSLSEKVSETSEVVFFILAAMTIVEVVDAHKGFKVVTDLIKSKKKRNLMWLISLITFFTSAILDNLTTTILMVSLSKKLLSNPEDRKIFGALIVIAANAGGAWTPIGDVTTTMLWINGQISAFPTMTSLFLPSVVSVILSTYLLQRQIPEDEEVDEKAQEQTELAPRGKLVFAVGLASLLSVPVFKAATGLPPYLGILASLGVMWTLTDAIHAGEETSLKAPAALSKIDTSGVLFFLGILLSVGALDSAGLLASVAQFLDQQIPNQSILATAIGFASALIDNVPLVAATMGMYPVDKTPIDSSLWQLIAYCAGTGGSIFVVGSAAGVALMGLESVDFLWYAKRISLSAVAGYLGGIGIYTLQQQFFPSGASEAIAAISSSTNNGII